MGGMKDLFGDTPFEPGLARWSDPDTSHEAAERVDTTRIESLVVSVLARFGPPRGQPMCVVEIWQRLPQFSVDTISPRMRPLVTKGLVIDLGKQPRASRHGKIRNQHVYKART